MSKGVTNYQTKLQALETLRRLLRLDLVRQSIAAQSDARALALAAEQIESDLADLDRIRKSAGAPPRTVRN